MDEEADRDPESPGEVAQRRDFVGEIESEFRERQQELEEEAALDPWDYWEETHDDLENPADYEVPPLWERLDANARTVRRRMDETDVSDPLALAIGKTRLFPWYWSPGDNDDLTQRLGGRDATRLYLYLDLSPLAECRIEDRINFSTLQSELGIENTVSQPTMNRMPGRMEDGRRTFYASEAETLVRQWQDTPFEEWVRDPTPETIAPDGEGMPPVQVIVRELRSKTFKYIRLQRDESTNVSKDAAMRVLVAAANGNGFVNDAAENLDLKPWYDGDEVPTGQTLIYHIRKSSREDITQMFLEANEPLFQIADDRDYFPEKAEIAIDITDWPYFGDPDSDEYIRGTKAGRNYARAWKYITLSLVGTDTPLILFVLPVKDRSNAPQYVRRMLRVARKYVNLHRVYLDAGTEFYNSDTISVTNGFDLELVMQGRKSGETIKRFLKGMDRASLDLEYYPYGVGDLDEDNYWAVGLKSEKKSQLRDSDPDEAIDDYTFLYTNVDPSDVPPEKLGKGFCRRWGIETSFRKIKEDFLAKSGAPDSSVRTFYFNFAAHLYNIWTTANILRADEVNTDLSEGKELTAARVMQAIEDDPHDLDIPTEPPKTRNVLGSCFSPLTTV